MQVQLSQRKLEFYFSLTFKEDQVHNNSTVTLKK